MRGLRTFGSPPPMSSRHRNLEPLGGGTRQYNTTKLYQSCFVAMACQIMLPGMKFSITGTQNSHGQRPVG